MRSPAPDRNACINAAKAGGNDPDFRCSKYHASGAGVMVIPKTPEAPKTHHEGTSAKRQAPWLQLSAIVFVGAEVCHHLNSPLRSILLLMIHCNSCRSLDCFPLLRPLAPVASRKTCASRETMPGCEELFARPRDFPGQSTKDD